MLHSMCTDEMLKQISSVYYQNENKSSQTIEKEMMTTGHETIFTDQFIETTFSSKQECQGGQQEQVQELIQDYKGTRLESHKKNRFNSFNIFSAPSSKRSNPFLRRVTSILPSVRML